MCSMRKFLLAGAAAATLSVAVAAPTFLFIVLPDHAGAAMRAVLPTADVTAHSTAHSFG
ncbi:hypothetical protein SAMN05216548_11078 [Faunimonas pinastri]|uniref:Uncharacterized protein n=2 Tax=Faunimonas pinastri TaxID=1855383 RepID=A0A1H9KU15_9HYPH|nr:hypothetical protein SAMN05216548_11078 [Faunimonas pinastri]